MFDNYDDKYIIQDYCTMYMYVINIQWNNKIIMKVYINYKYLNDPLFICFLIPKFGGSITKPSFRVH